MLRLTCPGAPPLRRYCALATTGPPTLRPWAKPSCPPWQDAYLQESLEPAGPRTITSPRTLRTHSNVTRAQGSAHDLEETAPGIRCIASPVPGPNSLPIAAIGVSGASGDLTLRRAAPAVKSAANTWTATSTSTVYRSRPEPPHQHQRLMTRHSLLTPAASDPTTAGPRTAPCLPHHPLFRGHALRPDTGHHP
ncbi:IclR family transcriptional regulator domain-containing protein [Kocuria sp. U4B]